MNIRDKNLNTLKDYEDNLKSHIEIEKSNIETILRTSMPHQLSNIKTILWVNLVIIGFSLSISYKMPFNFGLLFMWITSFSAVTLNVIALLKKRYKIYPEIDKMFAYNLSPTSNAKAKMLGEILTTIKYSIDENRKIMLYIADLMHKSLYLTLASLFFFFVYLGIATYQIKRSDDGKKTTATTKTFHTNKVSKGKF